MLGMIKPLICQAFLCLRFERKPIVGRWESRSKKSILDQFEFCDFQIAIDRVMHRVQVIDQINGLHVGVDQFGTDLELHHASRIVHVPQYLATAAKVL